MVVTFNISISLDVLEKKTKWLLNKAPRIFNEVLRPKERPKHWLQIEKPRYRKGGRFRRSTSKERDVEMLVVVDKKMVNFHGPHEIEPYVLTIMNIVSCRKKENIIAFLIFQLLYENTHKIDCTFLQEY